MTDLRDVDLSLEQPPNAISTSNWDLVSWPNRKPKIDNVGFEFWPLFLGVTEPEAELVVQPNKSAPAAKKPAKVRKRPAKKGPPAPAERER